MAAVIAFMGTYLVVCRMLAMSFFSNVHLTQLGLLTLCIVGIFGAKVVSEFCSNQSANH